MIEIFIAFGAAATFLGQFVLKNSNELSLSLVEEFVEDKPKSPEIIE